MPRVELGVPSLRPLPVPGAWIYTCRDGFELDLAEELAYADKTLAPRRLVPALLTTRSAPPRRDGRLDLTFARQAFPLAAVVEAPSAAELATRTAEALLLHLGGAESYTVHTWVPDSDVTNRLSQYAGVVHAAILQALDTLDPTTSTRRQTDARAEGGLLAQVCIVQKDLAFIGVDRAAEALSKVPGGRARMGASAAAPSRAAMKLLEALEWLGVGPEAGDRCVDLGAAPGGWTWVLLERGAHVTAIDPGKLSPDIARRKNVKHLLQSAFDYDPSLEDGEPFDWLFCDMVWRPLEVAALLAKWGRNQWARTLLSNIKLPMKKKVEMLARVRQILETGGWSDIRMRQLYHDREEITLSAWRR